MMLSPTGKLNVRGPDPVARSGGLFHASRLRSNGTEYGHRGVDLAICPWLPLFCPFVCETARVGISYKGDFRYHSLLLVGVAWEIKILYIWPYFLKGAALRRGQVIGLAEDLTKKYPRVINHVHLQARRKGTKRWTDPLPLLEAG